MGKSTIKCLKSPPEKQIQEFVFQGGTPLIDSILPQIFDCENFFTKHM